jgi:hypothetical protein
MKVIVNPWVKKFIEKSPTISRTNACGWLVGFQSSIDQTIILSAIAASRYTDTHANFRLPDPKELDELENILPNSLNVVGMYHFKPGSILKITSQAGIPEKYYKPYKNKLICATNTESTNWYTVNDMECSKNEVYYHEIPNNMLKSLLVLVEIDFATDLNLKLNFLSQISKDFEDSIKESFIEGETSLRTNSLLSNLSVNSSKPYFTREDIHSLLGNETLLKEFKNIKSALEKVSNSLSAPETYLSMKLSINKISSPETIKNLDKFTKFIGAYSRIIIPCIIMFNLQHPQSPDEFIKLLQSKLLDEIKYKIPRSMIKYSQNRKGLLVLPPESLLMQYKDVLLNVKTHFKKIDIVKKQFEVELVENLLFLSYFSQTHLPNIEKAFFAEEDKLIAYRQKFSTLARIGDKELGIGLLRGLGYLYKERGQIDSVTEVQRLASGL